MFGTENHHSFNEPILGQDEGAEPDTLVRPRPGTVRRRLGNLPPAQGRAVERLNTTEAQISNRSITQDAASPLTVTVSGCGSAPCGGVQLGHDVASRQSVHRHA